MHIVRKYKNNIICGVYHQVITLHKQAAVVC